MMMLIGQNHLVSGNDGRRWGTAHESIVPYQTFAAADGHFIAGTPSIVFNLNLLS
jgi:succinate--hydroxymethylglutarate CoA-transferase